MARGRRWPRPRRDVLALSRRDSLAWEPQRSLTQVSAALRAAADRPAAPLFFAALRAAAERSAGLRLRAAAFASRAGAIFDATCEVHPSMPLLQPVTAPGRGVYRAAGSLTCMNASVVVERTRIEVRQCLAAAPSLKMKTRVGGRVVHLSSDQPPRTFRAAVFPSPKKIAVARAIVRGFAIAAGDRSRDR